MHTEKAFCPVCNREKRHVYAYKVRNEYVTKKQRFLKFITFGYYKINTFTYCYKCETCGSRIIRDR